MPYLLEAAQRAALPRQGDVLPRAAALLDDARRVLDGEEKNLSVARKQTREYRKNKARAPGTEGTVLRWNGPSPLGR